MKIYSDVFDNGKEIPLRYTQEGDNVNPLLFFDDIPSDAKSLALVMQNPDGSDGLYHWVVWNIPPYVHEIFEGSPPHGVQGKNSLGHTKYDGPASKQGEHEYQFNLFALDTTLDLPPGAQEEEFEHAMRGHVIERAAYRGLYHPSRKRIA